MVVVVERERGGFRRPAKTAAVRCYPPEPLPIIGAPP